MHAIADTRVRELDLARQLVLLTLRSLDEQRVGRLAMCVPNALWSVFGPAYVELALRGIEGAHRVLAEHARRPPHLLRPVDGRLTCMEACILELLCAAAHEHEDYRDALCTWLVRQSGVRPLRCCAELIVRALNYRRLLLPPPDSGGHHASLPPFQPRPVANRAPTGRRGALRLVSASATPR